MKIWIMRHGEASFNAPSDQARTLTPKGEQMAFQQGQWLGKRLQDQNVSLDKIIISPYTRTQQTAAQLSQGLQAVGYSQNLAAISESWQGITPSGSPETVLDYLAFLRDEGAQQILLISHLPLVFDLVQHLTQFQHSVHFYPTVIAEIDWQHAGSKLVWVQAV